MILPITHHDSCTRNLMPPGATGAAGFHTMRDALPIGDTTIATNRAAAMIAACPTAIPAGMQP